MGREHITVEPPEEAQPITLDSSPRRPLTRSQTGYVPRRRRRDDSPPVPAQETASSPPRKRSKLSAKHTTEEANVNPRDAKRLSTPPPRRDVSEVSTAPSNTPSPNFTQLSLPNETSPSISDTMELLGHRSRVILPTPVPNLTKKSRGRRVPTKSTTDNDDNSKDSRLYVCKVESCGKCFHRGEHLKRHIRSIHTHEKRQFTYLHFSSLRH